MKFRMAWQASGVAEIEAFDQEEAAQFVVDGLLDKSWTNDNRDYFNIQQVEVNE